MSNCPVVKLAKESITGKTVKTVSESDVKDAKSMLTAMKAVSELRNNFDGISMAKINEFMDANIGVKDSKSNKAVAKPSIGFMCFACDDNNEKIYLDSCSQDHIIKSFDLITNMTNRSILLQT